MKQRRKVLSGGPFLVFLFLMACSEEKGTKDKQNLDDPAPAALEKTGARLDTVTNVPRTDSKGRGRAATF